MHATVTYIAWHSGHVFRYLTLPDILLTGRYITNEGLIPCYFITSPLAEIHDTKSDFDSRQNHSESDGHFVTFNCSSSDIFFI